MRVGFIGLGSQGGPMARRIAEGGFETTLWARRAASLEPYADTAAKTAGSPAELGALARETLPGGVGTYAGFVHIDSGPERSWTG